MPDLDDLAPSFRRAADRWPEAATLSLQLASLSAAHETGDHGLVGVAKSFVECVAKTIISEFSTEVPDNDSTTALVNRALEHVGFGGTRTSSPLSQVLSAHNRLADGLTAMRNCNDPNVHGKDGFLDILTENEMRVFLVTADALVGLLLAAYEGSEPSLVYTREPYVRFTHLHQRIDRRIPFTVTVDASDGDPILLLQIQTEALASSSQATPLELRLELSRLLYGVDRNAYVDVLNAATRFPASSPPEFAEPEPPTEDGWTATVGWTRPGAPDTTHAPDLKPLRGDFALEVTKLGVVDSEVSAVADAVLAAAAGRMILDWRQRATALSAIKVGIRRGLVSSGVDRSQADGASEILLAWLIEKSPNAQADVDDE